MCFGLAACAAPQANPTQTATPSVSPGSVTAERPSNSVPLGFVFDTPYSPPPCLANNKSARQTLGYSLFERSIANSASGITALVKNGDLDLLFENTSDRLLISKPVAKPILANSAMRLYLKNIHADSDKVIRAKIQDDQWRDEACFLRIKKLCDKARRSNARDQYCNWFDVASSKNSDYDAQLSTHRFYNAILDHPRGPKWAIEQIQRGSRSSQFKFLGR